MRLLQSNRKHVRFLPQEPTVKDGKLKASILLSETGYDYLYTEQQHAAAADERAGLLRQEAKPIRMNA